MPQDDSYQTNVYRSHGGNDLEIGSSGDLTIESDGALRACSGGSMRCSAAFDFFLDSETFCTDRLRNYLMGRGAWSIKVGSTGGTVSDTIVAGVVDSYPPITPSRMGYIVFSLANADTYSARLHSAHSGEELCIILRGEAGDGVSLELHFSADTSAVNLSGVSVIDGSTGDVLSGVLLYGSATSRAFLRLVGIADGTWAVIDSGQSTGDGATVVEQLM